MSLLITFYTTFDWDVKFRTDTLTEDGDIVVDVTVTNTGKVAGKDVVELYYSAPYTDYEIEKSHVVLGGYEKTDLIQPGMSDTVTITMSVRSMASYDYNDANANGITGYELDDGEYTIYVGGNSHVWADKNAAWTKPSMTLLLIYAHIFILLSLKSRSHSGDNGFRVHLFPRRGKLCF